MSVTSTMHTRKVLSELFARYAACIPQDRDKFGRLLWMCEIAELNIELWPLDKLGRWLGFIQGSLVASGHLTIEAETAKAHTFPRSARRLLKAMRDSARRARKLRCEKSNRGNSLLSIYQMALQWQC